MHAHMCTQPHMCITSYSFSKGAAICMKLLCLTCMHVHVCIYVCACVGHPSLHPPTISTHPIHLQGGYPPNSVKIQ